MRLWTSPANPIILLLFVQTTLFSQVLTHKEYIRAVQNADILYYYDEDYDKAASAYEELLKSYPENSNLAAKLGICYLNIDGKNKNALELLKKASKNVVSEEKEYVEYGDKSPLDTWLYLALAYQVNDSLSKALSLFNEVKAKLGATDIFREDYINNQIRNCRYAMEMRKKPLTIISELFVPWLTDYPGACNPVISKNDSVFIFTQKTGSKTRILCSYKNKNGWGRPSDITRQLGNYDRFYSNSITGDGSLLVLFMNDGDDGNLYFSNRKDTIWTRIKNPGKPINSIYWESHGFISPDGKTLYFASNRPGGEGDLDIWTSEKKPDNSWDKPVNCGPVINTPFNEDTPFFDPSSNALIFNSDGHISMGGHDIFRAIYRNGGWTNPVGLPYAFNTSAGNTFFIQPNNAPGFITSIFDTQTGSRNIFRQVAIDPSDEITLAEGTVTLSDGMGIERERGKITLTETGKKSILTTSQLTNDGKFRFEIKPGDYQIIVSYPGFKPDTINVNLPLYYLSRYMALESNLIPDKVSSGDFLSIKNILFAFNSFELDDKAISVLEGLRLILISNPLLKIEVAGYTDSKGSTEYNRLLAAKRARAVIDYLASGSVPVSRLVSKAYGESGFVAINSNPDGTDNPEGRSFNRRVAFGIVDPQTGVILRNDSYTPDRLRSPFSIKYNVVLKKSEQRLPPDHFSVLKLNGILFVRSVETDSISYYTVGHFYNRSDAVKFLAYAKDTGFSEAYIANHYDLNEELRSLPGLIPVVSLESGPKIYTIQIKATRTPLNMRIFSEIKEVREIPGEDGFFRYVSGNFNKLEEARVARRSLIEAGYKDAFIRELNLLINK